MAFGLSNVRDDRRRRVLTEEVVSTATEASVSGTLPVDGPSYAKGAAPENHPHVTDLVPRRYTTIALAVIGAASIVLGLEYLHMRTADLAGTTAGGRAAALDLAAPGALAVWFSSLMLTLASVMSVLIYSLRKHKIDDYRGRYRIWLWAAGGWIVLSINTTAPLHGTYVALMTHLTGWTAGPQGAFWWLTPVAIVFGTIGVRVLIDVHECRMAFVLLALAHAAWAAALALQFGWLPNPTWATPAMGIAGAVMSGHICLLTGLVLYARYVILDAQGLVPVRKRNHKDETFDRDDAGRRFEKSAQVKIDPPHALRAPTYQPARPVANVSTGQWIDGRGAVDEPYADQGGTESKKRRLSKSERKRLRKLKARQRRRE